MQKLKKSCPRAAAILLSLMMMVVFVPTFAFATDGDEGITVFMTVSEQGAIATAKDGSAMAWKEVKVKDLNDDNKYSYDEALVALHDEYYEGGAAAGYISGVSKFWGHGGSSFLFFVNDEGLSTGVTGVFLDGGEYLTAAYLTDTDLGLDWGTSFDKRTDRVVAGESVSLNLKGHLGMAYVEQDKTDVPLKDRQLGVWTEDGFSALEGVTTDTDGNATLSFDTPGTYVVTLAPEAKVTNTVVSRESGGFWYPFSSTTAYDNDDEEIWGKWDWSAMVAYGGYTLTNYGDGPYPYNEIQWVKAFDYNDLNFEMSDEDLELGYFMHSGDVIYDSPAIAPVCIVKVGAKPADVTMTLNDKGVLAKAKDGSAMIEKPVTVKDLDFDGKLTYDEALAAAHEAYCAEGKVGYSAGMQTYGESQYFTVTKLWGQGTSNAMFFANGAATTSVDQAVIAANDKLYTSINAEPSGRDFLTSFDKTAATVEVAADLNVNLKGHVGAGYTPEDLTDVNLANVPVGIWKDGTFEPMDGTVTDQDGNAAVSFKKTGTYILTAKGEVDGTDWSGNALKCPTMAPYCIVTVTPHTGVLTKTDAKAATCTEDGNSAYWTCNDCGKFFSDAEGKTAIEKDSWIILKGHKLTPVNAKLATDKKAGNTAYWKCTNGCGKFFSDAKGTKEIKKNSWVVAKSKMTVKAKKLTVKAEKKKTVFKKSKAFTVKKAPGKVTFKKTKGNKKIIVAKNGKVTVKKGLKKNKTYKVKVKVTSAKTKKYAKITKTVTLTIKVN